MGNLKNLFYSSFFSGIVSGALGVIMPVYLSEVFGTSLTSMGFVFSAYALLFALLQVPSSYLGDRFRRKTLLVISSLLDGAMLVVYALGSRVSHFFLGKGVEGVATALSRSPSDALLINLSEKHRFSESFGNLVGYFSVGYVLGFLIAGPLAGMLGFRKAILSLLLFQLVSLAFILLIRIKERTQAIKFNLKKFFHKPHRNLKILALTGMLITFVEYMDYTVTVIYVKEVYNASLTQIGVFMGASWLAYGIVQIFFGRFSDRRGRKGLYLFGAFVAGVSALLMPSMPSLLLGTACFALLAVGHGIAFPAVRGMTASFASKEYMSQDFGMVTAFEELGAVFGFPIMGWIADNLGYSMAFYLRGTVILVVAVVVVVLIKEKKKEAWPTPE